jgi:hypothetical protein
MASTTAKPRLIFPRNRKVGSFNGADGSLTPLKNPNGPPCRH